MSGCKDCVPQRGERGLRGNDGIQGETGPQGPAGQDGSDGSPGAPGAPANVLDTGWHDLLGFDCYQTTPPQARRIGTVIHFRGGAYIPLTDGTGAPLVQNSQVRNYEESTNIAPATSGACSVNIDTVGGSLTFNEGDNVLPLEVVNLNTNPLDGAGAQAYTMAGRRVLIEEDGDPGNLISTYLTTTGSIVMRPDGTLVWANI